MKRILIVNNDIDGMKLLKKWLGIKNFEVKFTSSHEKIKDIVENFAPHLLLVDILQSKVIEQLKNDAKTASIPIILMTGYTLRSGKIIFPADDSIDKPFNLDLLEKKIDHLISVTSKWP